MAYSYQQERAYVFTEAGQVQFLKIRDHVHSMLALTGAITLERAMSVGTGDSWAQIACVDRLVELGEIVRVERIGVHPASQYQVYVPAGR